eukprot:Pgem_evm1s7312
MQFVKVLTTTAASLSLITIFSTISNINAASTTNNIDVNELSDEQIAELSLNMIDFTMAEVNSAMSKVGTSLDNCYKKPGESKCPMSIPYTCGAECVKFSCGAHIAGTVTSVIGGVVGAVAPWIDDMQDNGENLKTDEIFEDTQNTVASLAVLAGKFAEGGQCSDLLQAEAAAMEQAKANLGLTTTPAVTVDPVVNPDTTDPGESSKITSGSGNNMDYQYILKLFQQQLEAGTKTDTDASKDQDVSNNDTVDSVISAQSSTTHRVLTYSSL